MRFNSSFIFPGSGCQYIGMGKEFYENFEVAKRTYEEASDILQKDFMKICFKGGTVKQNKIENLLPCIYVTSVALGRVLMNEFNYIPNYMAGHSLGEYSALTIADAIPFHEGLKIVQKRSDLAKEVAREFDAGMAIINGSRTSRVETLCKENTDEDGCVSIACFNTDDQVLISGNNSRIELVAEAVKKEGANVIFLIGSAPYHNILMKHIIAELQSELEKCNIKRPKYDVISNITVRPFADKEDIVRNLVLQMYNPIRWKEVIQTFEANVHTLIEVGPNNVLSTILQQNSRIQNIYSLDRDFEELKNISNNWTYQNDLNFISKCLKSIAGTPNYNRSSKYDLSQLQSTYQQLFQIEKQISERIISLDVTKKEEMKEKVERVLEMKHTPMQEKQQILGELEGLMK